MNYGELKTLVAGFAHRTDLAAQMDAFKQATEERICERFGYLVDPSLVNDIDTNTVLTENQNLYIYGMLEELSIYVQDGEGANSYRSKWDDTAMRLNITAGEWAGASPPGKIAPYIPE